MAAEAAAAPVRRVFLQMFVSLDGFYEGPNRELDWHVVDAHFFRYVTGMLDSIDAILLGRVTYELFAKFWPAAPDAEAVAAVHLVTRTEGVLPALETAHAFAVLPRFLAGTAGAGRAWPAEVVVLLGFSGRGDKDLAAIERFEARRGEGPAT